jgi:heme iron utilization protein
MEAVAQTIVDAIDASRSLTLSTLDDAGKPHTSYAPFVRVDTHCYILISDAARHTGYLKKRPECSALWIEDEAAAGQIFARKRVMLSCRADRISEEDTAYDAAIDALQKRFGDIIAMLRQMGDFHLFALNFLEGEAVFGFGEAYRIVSPFDEITPKRGGHASGGAK